MGETVEGRHWVLPPPCRAPHSALFPSAVAALYIFDLHCNGLTACEGVALGASPVASDFAGIVTLVESVDVRRTRVSGIGCCWMAVSSCPLEMMTRGIGSMLVRHRHSTTELAVTEGLVVGDL